MNLLFVYLFKFLQFCNRNANTRQFLIICRINIQLFYITLEIDKMVINAVYLCPYGGHVVTLTVVSRKHIPIESQAAL